MQSCRKNRIESREHKTMNKRTHKIISLFLTILLLFAGTYADAVSADALFKCNLIGETDATLAPCHSTINDATICKTESSNIDNIELQSQGRYRQQYREVNEFLSLQNSVFGSISRRKSYIHHAAKYSFCQTQNELLTEYMHQSDGKKRI